MNIVESIRSLRNGDAAKPANWRGYVKRIDQTGYSPYSEESTYSVGDKAVYNDTLYICVSPVTAGERFDYNKWNRIEKDYYIAFIDSDDEDSAAVPTPNPAAVYKATVDPATGSVTWSRLAAGTAVPWDPDETCPDPVDMPDAELFAAVMSSAWTSGSAADYETQRTGGAGRW